jgi:hypothetical protein
MGFFWLKVGKMENNFIEVGTELEQHLLIKAGTITSVMEDGLDVVIKTTNGDFVTITGYEDVKEKMMCAFNPRRMIQSLNEDILEEVIND